MIRPNNEDALLVDNDLCLFAVSDGMGGHAAGEVASRTALATLHRVVREGADASSTAWSGQEGAARAAALLESAVQRACAEVWDLASARTELRGMGATVTAVWVLGSRAILAHVGDSRLYLVRDGKAHQLTSDHTVANDLAAAGVIGKEDIAVHPYRNALSRSVGTQPAVKPDTLTFDVLPRDRMLLCSDGLSRYLEDPAGIAQMMARPSLEDIPESLVDHANGAGGRDNVTCVVVEVSGVDDTPVFRATRSRIHALETARTFGGLTLVQAARVLTACRTENYPAGHPVVREGQPLDALFIVVSGRVDMRRAGQRLRILEPGEDAGATALFGARQARATLVPLDDARMLVLTRERFAALVRARPWLGVRLLELLGRRLGETLDSIPVSSAIMTL